MPCECFVEFGLETAVPPAGFVKKAAAGDFRMNEGTL
jgi:hypothetical protein